MEGPTGYLMQIASARGQGRACGIYSVCTADPLAIRAALRQASEDGSVALIEATSNQVNQFGGYTGMRPSDFVEFVATLAAETGFPLGQLIIGGDHLGPGPWHHLAPGEAMRHGRDMVAAYVAAGFTKLHLDASMPLGDERMHGPLATAVVAERTAQLCEAAEAAVRERERTHGHASPPVYVIGSDVPPAGGRTMESANLVVTRPGEFERTVELTRQALEGRGLEDAWRRVVAVVVNPGVEFEEWDVHEYDRAAAASLSVALEGHPGLVFEAHSTDYQTPERLQQMVEDGFAILKVGPALTFAKREALFQLCSVEEELLAGDAEARRSNLVTILEEAMLADPRHWRSYYRGNDAELHLERKYSLLDRCRYYWPVPAVRGAVEALFRNLREVGIPLPLLSQYLPRQYDRVRAGELRNEAVELVIDRIRDVLRGYAGAVSAARRGRTPARRTCPPGPPSHCG